MTRAEKLAELDRRLSDDQLEDVLTLARHRDASQSVFETLPPDHQTRVRQAFAKAERGEGLNTEEDVDALIQVTLSTHRV